MALQIVTTTLTAADPHKGSVAHAAEAGLACLEAGGVEKQDLDLLINAGVYRDHNMCEPAMAALIQHEMGVNLDHHKFPVRRLTFSFDLMNGAVGPLNAVQVAHAILEARQLDHALIVTSDAHPSMAPHADFPMTTVGSAMLLRRTEAPGFGPMAFASSPAHGPGQRGYCDLHEHGTGSRTAITVQRDPAYIDRLVAFASQTADAFLSQHRVDRTFVRLICSQPSADFAPRLAAALDLHPTAVIDTFETLGDSHSSGLISAHHHARTSGALTSGAPCLWVGAGAGLTVGCALYEVA